MRRTKAGSFRGHASRFWKRSLRRWSVAVFTIPAIAACDTGTGPGEDGPQPPTPVTVASVTVNPSTLALEVGQSVGVFASITGSDGSTMNPAEAPLAWSSSDPSGLSVRDDGTGQATVTASRAGSYTVTASAGGQTGAASATVARPQLALSLNNRLLGDVVVTYNGMQTVVGGQQTVTVVLDPPSSLDVSWSLIRPTLSNGTSVGDPMSGSFATLPNPTGATSIEIDADVGGTLYFAPLVSNESSQALLLGVNMGLQSEKRCNCTAPANTQRVYFGYYRLFSNSNVRGYRTGSAYTGPYVFWDDLAAFVDPVSGGVVLTATSAPVPGMYGEPPARGLISEGSPATQVTAMPGVSSDPTSNSLTSPLRRSSRTGVES